MNNLLSLCAMGGIIKYQKTISLLMNFSINRFVEKPLEMKKFELSNEVYRNYDENTKIEQTIFNTIMNYHMFTKNYFPDFEKAKKNNNIIEDDNILYFDENKPKDDLDLYLEKVNIEYLYDLRKKCSVTTKQIFHESKQCYILNSYSIFEKLDKEANEYSRRISKSKYNDVVFDKPFENEMRKIDDSSKRYYDSDNLLSRLTTRCDNDHFRVAPDNYFILKLK